MDAQINVLTVGDKNFELLVWLVTASGVRRDIFGIRDQTMKLEFFGLLNLEVATAELSEPFFSI